MPSGEGLAALAQAKIGDRISFAPPRKSGAMSVEEAIARRRSIRDFVPSPISLENIGQLLWSAAGVTGSGGLRAAPSAGARYPLELYLACEQGLFRYRPSEHALIRVRAEDLRQALSDAALGQTFIADAAICVIFAAVYQRTISRYDRRGIRYVHMDVGHAAENVHLQAEALALGSVPVGAFDDAAVARILQLPPDHEPVYLLPVGRPAR